jgi:hypothetical protein
MSKKQVLLSICDRCHTEVQSDLIRADGRMRLGRKSEFVLPPGWLHVEGNTTTHTVFEVDLCEVCKGVVLDAAGSARRS